MYSKHFFGANGTSRGKNHLITSSVSLGNTCILDDSAPHDLYLMTILVSPKCSKAEIKGCGGCSGVERAWACSRSS